ncbi:MAG: hypothetical protein P4L30_00565 [Candidatus Limnocylindrales bacterium]|nr:hypothetical protein [Candidatus Limnocylindrales bacterium]
MLARDNADRNLVDAALRRSEIRLRAITDSGLNAIVMTSAIGSTLDLATRPRGGHEIPVQLPLAAVEIDGRWHAVGVARP